LKMAKHGTTKQPTNFSYANKKSSFRKGVGGKTLTGNETAGFKFSSNKLKTRNDVLVNALS